MRGLAAIAVVSFATVATATAQTTKTETTIRCTPGQPVAAALPVWSPASDRVAFTVPRDETGEIVTAVPRSSHRQSLATSWDSAPEEISWAPRGDAVAFLKRTGAIAITRPRTSSFGIEIVHAEYNTLTALGDWSPDAQLLLFTRDARIYTVDVITWVIRYLADGLRPTWSPDGSEIAFVAGRPPGGGIGPQRPLDLDVIHPDGTGRRTLVRDAPSSDTIAWSPDSSRLAFVGKVIGIVARTGGPAVYTAPAEGPLAWRANGIFYNLRGPAPRGVSAMRYNPDTGATSRLTKLPHGFEGVFASASPDGRRIAYTLYRDYLRAGVRVVDATGKNDSPLLACTGSKGPDRVIGSRLNDVIRVNGAGRDRVNCGAGQDLVYADSRDVVARDCERVIRS
ncbi:MAG: TolB protein [Gaiellaceae bacterium]|nr:TolB protein [Gaiellaceae bacterium]